MFFQNFEELSSFGWNEGFERHWRESGFSELHPGRIVGEQKELYQVQAGPAIVVQGRVRGRLMHEARGRADFPAVGDWVLFRPTGDPDRVQIETILPRQGRVERKQVGASADSQIIAANVDVLFIATSMNGDLNAKRLDRYLALAWDSGARPVLVLTKADLSSEPEAVVAQVESRFPGVEVRAVSRMLPQSIRSLAEVLDFGKTGALVGSSGVGKSSILNALLRREILATAEVREDDGKGRHTTTSRFLFRAPFGGLLIDTPGMRELPLMVEEDDLRSMHGAIEDLVLSCRFTDCGHGGEPGCAIREALESGDLDPEVWDSHLKLLREARHLQRRRDKSVQSEDRKKWKKMTQAIYEKHRNQRRR